MKTISASGLRALLFSGLACTLAVASGCQGPITEDAVHPRVEFTNRAKQAISGLELVAVNGTYGAGCAGRFPGNWSAAIEGYPALRYAALSVVKDNTACELTVTSLSTDVEPEGQYTAVTPILMTSAYDAVNEFRFVPEMNVDGQRDGAAFFANAKLSVPGFATDFVLDVIYSKRLADLSPSSPGEVTGTPQEAEMGTSSFTSVDASDYSIDMTPSDRLAMVLDPARIVVSASGSLTLKRGLGNREGDGYVVVSGWAAPMFQSIDTVYKSLTNTPIVAGADVKIPWTAFNIVGARTNESTDPTNEAVERTVIIQKATGGVPAYQAFEIRFSAPIALHTNQ